MNLADTTPSPPPTTPVIARSNTKAPRSAARAADPPELNALVQQRFRTAAAAYADWPLDRRRAWRAELAAELNASQLSGSFQWDERSVTTKLANLGLRVRPAANDKTPRRDAAVAPARLLDFGAQVADDRCHSSGSSNIADHDAGNSSDKENDACSNGTEPAKQLSPSPLASFLVASQRHLLATAAVARASLSHNGLRGAAHECALATFLRDNCSTSVVGVGSGEVLFPARSAAARRRRQLDVVLFDRRVPTLAPGGDGTQLFFSPAVLAVLEVKSVLTADEFASAVQTAARDVAPLPYVLVAFATSLSLSTVAAEWSQRAADNVLAVVVLGEGVVSRTERLAESGAEAGAHVFIQRDDQHCALAWLYAELFRRCATQSSTAAPSLVIADFL